MTKKTKFLTKNYGYRIIINNINKNKYKYKYKEEKNFLKVIKVNKWKDIWKIINDIIINIYNFIINDVLIFII